MEFRMYFEILWMKDLGAIDKLVFGRICDQERQGKSQFNRVVALSQALGENRRTVARSIKKLTSLGHIEAKNQSQYTVYGTTMKFQLAPKPIAPWSQDQQIDGDKIDPSIIKDGDKMDPSQSSRWGQNEPKMGTKSTQDGDTLYHNQHNQHNQHRDATKNIFKIRPAATRDEDGEFSLSVHELVSDYVKVVSVETDINLDFSERLRHDNKLIPGKNAIIEKMNSKKLNQSDYLTALGDWVVSRAKSDWGKSSLRNPLATTYFSEEILSFVPKRVTA